MVSSPARSRSALNVRLATGADLERVSEFLARTLAGAGGAARYRRLLEYSWLADKPNIGALIEDDAGVGGFLGALYSQRMVAGQLRPFCNFTSWSVAEPYRRASLSMLKCLLDQRGHTFTSFSASPSAAEILGALKFQRHPSHKLLFTAASSLVRRRRGEPVEVLDGADQVAPRLDPDHRRILDDHRPYRCGHLLVERGNQRCYAVTIARGHGRRVFADVLYASDPQLFVDCIAWVQGPLFRAHRTVLTGIDLRLVDRPPPLAICYTALRPVMFRSDAPAAPSGAAGSLGPRSAAGSAAPAAPAGPDRMTPRDVCALYSELVPMYG